MLADWIKKRKCLAAYYAYRLHFAKVSKWYPHKSLCFATFACSSSQFAKHYEDITTINNAYLHRFDSISFWKKRRDWVWHNPAKRIQKVLPLATPFPIGTARRCGNSSPAQELSTARRWQSLRAASRGPWSRKGSRCGQDTQAWCKRHEVILISEIFGSWVKCCEACSCSIIWRISSFIPPADMSILCYVPAGLRFFSNCYSCYCLA